MDKKLERAIQYLAENGRNAAKTLYMSYLGEKRRSNTPVSSDEAYAIGYVYGALNNNVEGGFKVSEKKIAETVLRNIIRVSDGYEATPSSLPELRPELRPDLGPELQLIDPQIEAALKEQIGAENYNKLDPETQALLKSVFVRDNADALHLKPIQADNYSDEYIVDFINKVVDNANNYIGMTKLGPTTAIILQGELHGRLSSVIVIGDRKDYLAGPNDMDYLGFSLSKHYSTYLQDIEADKVVNKEATIALAQTNEELFREKNPLTPQPKPGASVTDDEENPHKPRTPFPTIPSPFDE